MSHHPRHLVWLLLLMLTACRSIVSPPAPSVPSALPPFTATATVSPTPPPTDTPTPAVPLTATPSPPAAASPTMRPATTPPAALAPPPGALAGRPSIGDPKAPELGATGYDVESYTLRLTLDPAGRRLSGDALIKAAATLDRLGQISLDFADGMDVRRVSLADRDLPWQYRGDRLVVNLPRPYAAGEGFDLTVSYGGPIRPIKSRFVSFAEVGMQVRDDGSLFVVAEPDGARAWFPANDHPLDKARFRLEITVPPPLVAAATGVLRERRATPDGMLYVWEMSEPMAPYLASIMVAPYERLESRSPAGLPLRHYVPTTRRAEMEALFAVTGPALDWFAARLGPYPFAEFGYTVVSLPGASLETQSNVLLSERMLSQGTMIHEMAHMWFGDSVSLASWADIWRNEGFATYFTWLWEHRDDEAAIPRAANELETRLTERPTDYPLGDPPPAQLFGQDPYLKGAWVVHMLRHQVGDETFYEALRLYFERYRGRAASRTEFEAVFSEVAGRDLRPFFAAWLDRPGLPQVDVTWTSRASNGRYRVEAQLCETAAPSYPVEMEIAVSGDGGYETAHTPLRDGSRVTFDLPYAPTTVTTDPAERLLARETVTRTDTLQPCPP